MTRKKYDAYYTPAWQTHALLRRQEITGVVLDPCNGDGAISRLITRSHTITNDINPDVTADMHVDAADGASYETHFGEVDWVVTNPPYSMPLCSDIVAHAVTHAKVGVAMLLRLSFLEPIAKKQPRPRGEWLRTHPPTKTLVLPRYSYTRNGKSDSCTTAWMIWIKGERNQTLACLYDEDSYRL